MANPWWHHHLPAAHVRRASTRCDRGRSFGGTRTTPRRDAPAVLRYAPAAGRCHPAGDHVAYVRGCARPCSRSTVPGLAARSGGHSRPRRRRASPPCARWRSRWRPGWRPLRPVPGESRRTGSSPNGPPPAKTFPAEIWAAGLARVLAASYGRPAAALVFDLPEGLSEAQERAIVSAAGWLAHHGGFGIWLTGAAPMSLDTVDTVTIRLPQVPMAPEPAELPTRPSVDYPHRSVGRTRRVRPRTRSKRRCGPRRGRPDAPGPDLPVTSVGRAVPAGSGLGGVPVCCGNRRSGPSGAAEYEADRRRDMRLLLDGYAVLRFTNAQVLSDARTVASQIEQFLRLRTPREGPPDAQS